MNVLSPLGILYGRIMDVRNRMYDRGLLRSHSLGARTISIGNLTTGGTGKTPVAALAASILAENGEKVCVLTRGYGRADQRERVLVSDAEEVLADSVTGGDEPIELAYKLLGKAIVVADGDRVAAAKWAKERFDITAFVLDDAFQHRRARRDIDIVCIDATNPCGNGHVLPAGTLRESLKALRRANILVITRANLVDSTENIAARLKRRNPGAAIFRAETRISRIVPLKEFPVARQATAGVGKQDGPARTLAFCGLGNPENFRRQLESEGLDLVGLRAFADHCVYTQQDIDLLVREAGEASATSLITTAKDAVKLAELRSELPIYVAEIELKLDDPVEFQRLLLTG